jgi:hypothetical protein
MQIQIGVMFFISHATLCLLRCTLFMHGVCVTKNSFPARVLAAKIAMAIKLHSSRCGVLCGIWASAFEVRRPIFHTVSMAMCLSRDQRRPPTNDMTPVLRQQHVLRR